MVVKAWGAMRPKAVKCDEMMILEETTEMETRRLDFSVA